MAIVHRTKPAAGRKTDLLPHENVTVTGRLVQNPKE